MDLTTNDVRDKDFDDMIFPSFHLLVPVPSFSLFDAPPVEIFWDWGANHIDIEEASNTTPPQPSSLI